MKGLGLGDHEVRLWYEMGDKGCRLKGKSIVVEGHIIQILIKSRVQTAGSLVAWLSGCQVKALTMSLALAAAPMSRMGSGPSLNRDESELVDDI